MPPQTTPETDNQAAIASSGLITTPAGAGISIEDVNKSLWQYIKQRKLWELILLAPLVVIWEIFVIFLFIKYFQSSSGGSSGSGRGFGYMFFAPFLIFSSWLYKIKKQFEDAFLEEFALANGYSYDKDGAVDETYGTIFRLKGDQQVSDVITGKYGGDDIRMFICEVTIGAGNGRQTYQDTVLELDLHGQLPNLLMVNKKSRYNQLNLTSSFGIKNTFSLEGDFDHYFTLYGNSDNQIEALEVFSPDTMELMENESNHYTVEFSGNRIYIYVSGLITNTNDLTQVFGLAKKLIEKIAPLASRLQNDSAIIPAPINIIKNRQHNRLVQRLRLGASIALIFLGFGIMALALFSNQHEQHRLNIDSAPAVTLSREFMFDLSQGDIAKAKSLESPKLQNDAGQNQYLDTENFRGVGNSSLISQQVGSDSKGPWVGVIYEDDSGDRPFYIKLLISQYGQSWRVWFFQTSYNKLGF